jgi:copper chaperone CopZ
MQTLDLKIDGMSCGSCVSHVRKALEGVSGVDVANVSIGSAQVRVNENATPDVVATVIEAIDDAGYRAEVATEA